MRSIYNKIRYIGKKDIIQISFWNMLATTIKMLVGLVSVKVVAIIIGPAGMALMGQLNNFTTMLMTIATGGINGGVTKYVAEYKGTTKVSSYVSTALRIILVSSIITGSVCIAGANYWSKKILHDIDYSIVFILFGSLIILYALNTFFIAIMNGYKEFKRIVIVNISGSIVGLIFSIILVLLWGVKGALIASVTSQSVVFVITYLMISNASWFAKEIFSSKIDLTIVKKFSHYTLMTIIGAITVPVSQLIVRSYLVGQLSLDIAGLWESMNRISAMYLMIITASFGVYYLPRLSELTENFELKAEIIKAYKLFIPLLIVISLFIYLFKEIIVNILFSKDFFGMTDLFIPQLIGDFFKICGWLLAYILVAKSMTKLYIVTEIIFNLLFVALSYFLIPKYGVQGATIAYAINYFIFFIFMIFIFRKILFAKLWN